MAPDNEKMQKALSSYYISHSVPSDLDTLSTHTYIEEISDVTLKDIRKHEDGFRVRGSGRFDVRLDYGGGGSRDGLTSYDSFPFEFTAVVSDGDEIEYFEALVIDTSSFDR